MSIRFSESGQVPRVVDVAGGLEGLDVLFFLVVAVVDRVMTSGLRSGDFLCFTEGLRGVPEGELITRYLCSRWRYTSG